MLAISAKSAVAGVPARWNLSPLRTRPGHAGFTLIETLVVVGIVGILAAVAGPSFSDLIRNTRLSAASSALQVSLSLARSEAVKRGADARVSVAASGTAGAFINGWTVFVDNTGNANAGVAPTADSATVTRLEVVAAPSSAIGFAKSAVGLPNSFTYNGQGRMTNLPAGGSYFFSTATSERYCVIISNTGRVRTGRVASGVSCSSA